MTRIYVEVIRYYIHVSPMQARRQAVRQPRPGFRLVRARVRSTTSTTTASPDDYFYYEVPEDSHTPAPTRPPFRGRGRVVGRFRGRGQQRPAPNPIPPPPSYEDELEHYGQRADGRIIDFYADPNFPRELKGADLTDYPFYENLPEDINFDCSKWHDGFYASIPHKCQMAYNIYTSSGDDAGILCVC
ncbi:hypothetical protein HPB49_022357 [Dermacentor silvarum]|uniref:Uncharacterized protein n=1 Tax=Dermacentor silvarum TaxID=543639 RepID=A0ACB8CN43_DERSI|nr:hypothetical protein HPB49_022357 [Dermacentor silvarum]